jgi:hypothetical protein
MVLLFIFTAQSKLNNPISSGSDESIVGSIGIGMNENQEFMRDVF